MGYTLFLWTSFQWIGVATATPDMLVAAVVYLASGLLVRIIGGANATRNYALLGAVLGLGYLAKQAMLPVSCLFAGALLSGAKRSRESVVGIAAFTLALGAVAAPFAYSLSNIRHEWTFGQAGRLNYIFHVSAPRLHLAYGQTQYSGRPEPIHAPRRVSDQPLIYDFSTPVGGTYPLWFDPAYWNEGIEPTFRLDRQLEVLTYNLQSYFSLAWLRAAPVAGAVLLAFLRVRSGAVGWSRLAFVAAIGLAALGMYAAVHVELRYLGPFVTLLWIGFFAGGWWRDEGAVQERTRFTVLALLLVFGIECAYSIARPEAGRLWRRLRGSTQRTTHNREAAGELIRMGIQPGDPVARVGTSFVPQWARLAGVRVIAEVPNFYTDDSWQSSPAAAQRAVRALNASGARYLVTERPLPHHSVLPWRPLGDSGHSVLDLQKRLDE